MSRFVIKQYSITFSHIIRSFAHSLTHPSNLTNAGNQELNNSSIQSKDKKCHLVPCQSSRYALKSAKQAEQSNNEETDVHEFLLQYHMIDIQQREAQWETQNLLTHVHLFLINFCPSDLLIWSHTCLIVFANPFNAIFWA